MKNTVKKDIRITSDKFPYATGAIAWATQVLRDEYGPDATEVSILITQDRNGWEAQVDGTVPG